MPNEHCVEPLLASIAKAERHIISEYGTGMVGVMDTIGAYPHFAMPLQPGSVAVISGRDDVDAMYRGSVENAEPKASRILSQLASDWYVFIENVPTRHWIGIDRPLTVQTVTMFVTDDPEGITGEFAWERRYPPSDTAGAADTVPLPDRALANLDMHEALLAAMCAGDSGAVSALLDPDCVWAQRDYLRDVGGGAMLNLKGPAQVAEHVARWHAAFAPQHVSIINRRVTDWYVFSEELWLVRPNGGEPRQMRTATVLPVSRDGLFEAALGFGREVEAPAASACKKLGRPFWTAPGVAIGDVQRF